MSDSLLVGVGSGAVTGAVISKNINGGGTEHVGTGAAIGAAVGALGSYLIHRGLEKRDDRVRRETLLNLERYDVTPNGTRYDFPQPTSSTHMLTKPAVDVEWVDTRVDGGKLVEGHRVWRVTEPPRWIPGTVNKEVKENK